MFGRVVSLSPNETAVLSTLLANRGRPVRLEHLIEELWPDPDCEPESARKSVSRYVEVLRKALGKHTILTMHRGLLASHKDRHAVAYLVPVEDA